MHAPLPLEVSSLGARVSRLTQGVRMFAINKNTGRKIVSVIQKVSLT